MNKQYLSDQEKNDLVEAVGGPEAARSLIRGNKRIIDRFPLYTEVAVGAGAYQSIDDCVAKLSNKGYLKDEVVGQVLLSPYYVRSLSRQDLKLALVSAKDLGLPNGGFLSEIFAVARSRELELCPQDTATALMLQLSIPWSSGRSSFVVASNPVVYEEAHYLFSVSERRLRVVPADAGHHWDPLQLFLFRRL